MDSVHWQDLSSIVGAKGTSGLAGNINVRTSAYLLAISFCKAKTSLCLIPLLLLFYVVNLALSPAYAQGAERAPSTDFWSRIIEETVTATIPLVAAAIAAFIPAFFGYARKQGLKISAEAEEYFVKATKSFVENASREIYDDIRKNRKDYMEHISQGRVPPTLGGNAKKIVKEKLMVELRSDEFTNTTRSMLAENLDNLVERYVTEHKREMADRVRKLMEEFVPIAVNAELLPYKTQEEIRKNIETIQDKAFESVGQAFDHQRLLFSHADAKTHIKAELNKLVGAVK